MKNQAYILVKALKFFRIYVFHSKILAYVPNIAVKEILVQPDSGAKRGRWIAISMEYGVDIKPAKLVGLISTSYSMILAIHIPLFPSLSDCTRISLTAMLGT